jgi:hypothetical protein
MKEERTSRFGYLRKLKRIHGVVFIKELQVSRWFFSLNFDFQSDIYTSETDSLAF